MDLRRKFSFFAKMQKLSTVQKLPDRTKKIMKFYEHLKTFSKPATDFLLFSFEPQN